MTSGESANDRRSRSKLIGSDLRPRLLCRSRSPSRIQYAKDESTTSEGTSSTTSMNSHDDQKTNCEPDEYVQNKQREKSNCSNSGNQKSKTKPPNHTQKVGSGQKSQSIQKSKIEQERKKRQESLDRKSDILNSLGKFQAPSPIAATPKSDFMSLRRDPYAVKSLDLSRNKKTDGDDDSDSLSLGSLPPPEREERSLENSASASMNASMNLSGHNRMNSSMDLSGHNFPSSSDRIVTSASDEQWARFKLLGRLGLGTIRLSPEAQGLVERNYGIMLNAIRNIYALRAEPSEDSSETSSSTKVLNVKTGHLLEEIHVTIDVPSSRSILKRDPSTIHVDRHVCQQLKDYIVVIASLYQDNSFHDYEHASNVLRAVDRLIGLVSLPEGGVWDYRNLKNGHGVAREPWNHFALVFAAMIHDVDHNGVPNAQLIKEKSHVAGAYKNKSVAEQNSIELAWNLLMEPCYKSLRDAIFLRSDELTSFRKLVVTAVMATDIADKELAALRKGRAADALKAQEDDRLAENAGLDLVSRKATFVVETLIQVADVSHTMSSFETFKKWNHRLFKEMYQAFKNGRAEQDPTLTWYKGEFGFFDFYIIPLAKKLTECGIYGNASQEYLNNAQENRRLWEEMGEDIVKRYVAELAEKEKRLSEMSDAMDSMIGGSFAAYMDAAEEDSDDSDEDSISISSAETGDSSLEDRAVGQGPSWNRRQAMSTFGRVPSKSSLGLHNGQRQRVRSQSPSSSEVNQSSRRPSSSPGEHKMVATRGSPLRGSKSERLLGRSLFKNGFSCGSPISGTDRSPGRSILKKKFCEFSSPGSASGRIEKRSILKTSSARRLLISPSLLKESSLSDITGGELKDGVVSRRGNPTSSKKKSLSSTRELLERCRSQSPASHRKTIGQSAILAGPKRGRRPARSKSPSSGPPVHEIPPQKLKRASSLTGNALRGGRRPSRSKSPGSTMADGGILEKQRALSQDGIKRGKRPSAKTKPKVIRQ